MLGTSSQALLRLLVPARRRGVDDFPDSERGARSRSSIGSTVRGRARLSDRRRRVPFHRRGPPRLSASSAALRSAPFNVVTAERRIRRLATTGAPALEPRGGRGPLPPLRQGLHRDRADHLRLPRSSDLGLEDWPDAILEAGRSDPAAPASVTGRLEVCLRRRRLRVRRGGRTRLPGQLHRRRRLVLLERAPQRVHRAHERGVPLRERRERQALLRGPRLGRLHLPRRGSRGRRLRGRRERRDRPRARRAERALRDRLGQGRLLARRHPGEARRVQLREPDLVGQLLGAVGLSDRRRARVRSAATDDRADHRADLRAGPGLGLPGRLHAHRRRPRRRRSWRHAGDRDAAADRLARADHGPRDRGRRRRLLGRARAAAGLRAALHDLHLRPLARPEAAPPGQRGGPGLRGARGRHVHDHAEGGLLLRVGAALGARPGPRRSRDGRERGDGDLRSEPGSPAPRSRGPTTTGSRSRSRRTPGTGSRWRARRTAPWRSGSPEAWCGSSPEARR